jgi:hypothetical protein
MVGEGDDFRLAPPDCPSREDWQRRLAPPVALEPTPPPPSEWPRFGITDLLVVTAGAAIGLAGGTWMPADLFAAILGLATLVGLLLVHLFPPSREWASCCGRRWWWATSPRSWSPSSDRPAHSLRIRTSRGGHSLDLADLQPACIL